MKDYLSIKEFAKLSGIEQTTLRYWDDIGLFSPAKRDPENNYRYYTHEQIIAVKFITVLSELNIPLRIIADIQDGRTPEKIVNLIEHQERVLDREMNKLREKFSVLHARLEMINYGKYISSGFYYLDGARLLGDNDSPEGVWVDGTKIVTLQREERTYVLGPPNEWEEGKNFYEAFIKFCKSAEDLRINLSLPVGGYHNDFKSFMKRASEPDRFFSFDPTGNRIIPAGKYVTGYFRGYYGELGDLPDRVAAYLKQNKLKAKGPVFTLYLLDEVCISDPSQYLGQIRVAVT